MQYSVIKKRPAGSVQHMPQINFLGTDRDQDISAFVDASNKYIHYLHKQSL